MLCMYICAISCWQWAVKWLLRTLLSIWVWIPELNLGYCRGNVLIHWQKIVIYTNDCRLLSRAGAVVVVARWPAATPGKHRNTGRRKREVTQKHYLLPERKLRDFNMAFFGVTISLLRSHMRRRVKTYSALKQEKTRVYLAPVCKGIRKYPRRTERRTCWHVCIQPLVQCRSLVQWHMWKPFHFLNIDLAYTV